MCNDPAFASIDALTSHPFAEKRMMWVVDGYKLADMDRMTLRCF